MVKKINKYIFSIKKKTLQEYKTQLLGKKNQQIDFFSKLKKQKQQY